MSIRRRFILQAGTSFLLTASIQGCIQNSASTSTLKISKTLLKQIKKRGYLLVATEEDYPPFEFLLNGKPTGFDNVLLTRLRQEVPFEIRQEIVPWQKILPGILAEKYDVALTAAGITDERAKLVSFTTPIAESTIAYLKRKDDTERTALYTERAEKKFASFLGVIEKCIDRVTGKLEQFAEIRLQYQEGKTELKSQTPDQHARLDGAPVTGSEPRDCKDHNQSEQPRAEEKQPV